MSADLRLLAYTPNGDALAVLGGGRGVSVPQQTSAPTAANWDQPVGTTGADLVTGAIEVQPQVRKGGGEWADLGGRFDLTVAEIDLVGAEQVYRCEAVSMWSRLANAIVYGPVPVRDLGQPAQRTARIFEGQTAAQIMQTVIGEEQDRGRLVGITLDAAGDLPAVDRLELQHGGALDVALTALCDRGACRATWQGRTLVLRPVGSGMDRTTGADPVLLTVGRDLLDAPRRISREDQVSVAMVTGDNAVTVEVSGGVAPATGPAICSIEAPGVSDTATLQAIGTRELARRGRERTEWRARLDLQSARFVPGVDYDLDDVVLLRLSGSEVVSARVVQLIVATDEQGVMGCTVVLGDKHYEYEDAQAKAQKSRIYRQKPTKFLDPDFDPSQLPWNPEWGDQGGTPGTGSGECSPTCSCRIQVYPHQLGQGVYKTPSVISAANDATTTWLLGVIDYDKLDGHRYRANLDALLIKYGTSGSTQTSVNKSRILSVDVWEGRIKAGQDDVATWWRANVPTAAKLIPVKLRDLTWTYPDERSVSKEWQGGLSSYTGQQSGGSASYRSRLVVVMSTKADTTVNNWDVINQSSAAAGLTVDDLGPAS